MDNGKIPSPHPKGTVGTQCCALVRAGSWQSTRASRPCSIPKELPCSLEKLKCLGPHTCHQLSQPSQGFFPRGPPHDPATRGLALGWREPDWEDTVLGFLLILGSGQGKFWGEGQICPSSLMPAHRESKAHVKLLPTTLRHPPAGAERP